MQKPDTHDAWLKRQAPGFGATGARAQRCVAPPNWLAKLPLEPDTDLVVVEDGQIVRISAQALRGAPSAAIRHLGQCRMIGAANHSAFGFGARLLALDSTREIEKVQITTLGTALRRHSILLSVSLCALLANCGDPGQNTTLGRETPSSPAAATKKALPPEQSAAVAHSDASNGQLPDYEVVFAPTVGGYNPATKINAVVSGTITEDSLRRLLLKLLAEANSSAGQRRVFIYLFQSHEHFESGMGQWIAMLRTDGDSQPRIDFRTEIVEQLGEESETLGGLPEESRKDIFLEIARAEDRAEKGALVQYPFVSRRKPPYSEAERTALLANQSRARNLLEATYKSELAKRYGVTEAQLEEIQNEGSRRNWPLPDE